MSIAALLMVGFGSWVVYQNGTLRLTTVSPEAYVTTITGQVAAIMCVGLGDHLHCAVLRRRANHSKTAIDNLPPQFKDLLAIVRRRVPGDLPLVSAHECRYHGRKFVHLTFGNNRSLLSLVIARKQDGELLGTGCVRLERRSSRWRRSRAATIWYTPCPISRARLTSTS